jgi:hypothetical protein
VSEGGVGAAHEGADEEREESGAGERYGRREATAAR